MIPILFENSDISFVGNGLGRLRDCLSCTVTEERNGIYECDFQYPVDGLNYEEIIPGRIILVKHEYSNDLQPFDIVSYSKPINKIVTFHAVHISYRQSKIVSYSTHITGISVAFDMLTANATPPNPFTYGTNVQGSGYMAAADGEPRTVKSLLGGIEGSILDTYGGEYEWDKFNVYLHQSRGVPRDFIIRYGLNLLDYKDDADFSETYSSIIPYWKGTDENGDPLFIIGDVAIDSQSSYTGRMETIPVDLTDKFESQPTKYEVEAMARDYLSAQQPTIPQRNITINFTRLSESEEYEQYSELLECGLCDTITVYFPLYNMRGRFKIVKTVYDVLLEKYDSMELGALPTTLSQALGLSK